MLLQGQLMRCCSLKQCEYPCTSDLVKKWDYEIMSIALLNDNASSVGDLLADGIMVEMCGLYFKP
jgi:hypothetical protein